MSKTVKIPVPDGLITHAGAIQEVILREPTYDEFMTIGEPVSIIYLPSGEWIPTEIKPNIDAYIAACLVQPKTAVELESGGLKLARAVKAAVLGFFRNGDSAGELSTTSPTNSSGSAAKEDSAQSTSSE